MSSLFDMYFGGLRYAAFDIETTGLSPKFCSTVLTGFAVEDGGELKSRQYFAENLNCEMDVLARTLEEFAELDFVVTYNGATFDFPFVLERLKRNGMKPGRIPYNLDLYPVVRKFSDIRTFVPNLRQKTLENFLGLWEEREDEIDGGQSIELYYEYLACHDEKIKEKIILHNNDDVLQLCRLLDVIGRTNFHRAMSNIGFPVKTEPGLFTIKGVRISRGKLLIKGLQPHGMIATYVEPGDGTLTYELKEDGTFEIKLSLLKEQGLMLADTDALNGDSSDFEHLPTYGSGYLILSKEGKDEKTGKSTPLHNYMEINLLARSILSHIVEDII